MSKFLKQRSIVLASGSAIRAKLLESLGIEFSVIPSQCDEDAVKATHQSGNILDLGYTLAQTKALDVSKNHPNSFIIAADQLCVIGDKLLDKPLTHATTIAHLRMLSGNKHQQIACVCIAKDDKIVWRYHDIAYLTLRTLTNQQIEHYLQTDKPYHSCGAYQFETQGKWLFSDIQGATDTILGLPLLPLTNALLDLGAVSLRNA